MASWICGAGGTVRFSTITQLPRLFQGTVDRAKGCSIRRITRATIESERRMVFHVDASRRRADEPARSRPPGRYTWPFSRIIHASRTCGARRIVSTTLPALRAGSSASTFTTPIAPFRRAPAQSCDANAVAPQNRPDLADDARLIVVGDHQQRASGARHHAANRHEPGYSARMVPSTHRCHRW
jgi:hypothetical protein